MAMDVSKFKVERESFATDMGEGTVTNSYPTQDPNEAHEFLGSMDAKQLAIGHAVRAGMTDPRISGNTFIYLADANGQPVEQGTKQKGVGFCVDIPLAKKLIG